MARIDLTASGGRITKAYREIRGALSTSYDLSAFDPSAYAPEDVAFAAHFWRMRMASEHRSVHVFGQLALQLIEANAPLDAKTVVLRMAQDELIHTEACGDVLAALGEEPWVEGDIAVLPLARHDGVSASQRALRNVVYTTCLSEMIAVGRIADSLETAQDPAIRSVVRSILADEVMHGQFGFLYLDILQPVLAARPELTADLAAYLVHAFAVLEEELAGAARIVPTEGAAALGVLIPARAREVFYGTVADAIVPGLEARGVDAARAWRTRRRLA